MKNKSFILGLILTALVAGVIYFGAQKQASPAQVEDWKTYSNDKYGFSFQYPVGLKYEEQEMNSDYTKQTADGPDNMVFEVVFSKNQSSSYEMEILVEKRDLSAPLFPPSLSGNDLSKGETLVGGKTGMKYTYQEVEADTSGKVFGEGIYETYYVESNGYVYRLDFVPDFPSVEKVISTFEFSK